MSVFICIEVKAADWWCIVRPAPTSAADVMFGIDERFNSICKWFGFYSSLVDILDNALRAYLCLFPSKYEVTWHDNSQNTCKNTFTWIWHNTEKQDMYILFSTSYVSSDNNPLSCYSVVGTKRFITSYRGLTYITLLPTAEIREEGVCGAMEPLNSWRDSPRWDLVSQSHTSPNPGPRAVQSTHYHKT